MRRALILMAIGATAVFAPNAGATTHTASGSCGCVTSRLEHWAARNELSTSHAAVIINNAAFDSTNPPAPIAVAAVGKIMPEVRRVGKLTLDKFKEWKNACVNNRLCNSVLACLSAWVSVYTVELANGKSERRAKDDADLACEIAGVSTFVALSGSPTHAATWARVE